MEQQIKHYFDYGQKLLNFIHVFLEKEDDFINEYQNLIRFIESEPNWQIPEIINMISKVSKNYHRQSNFFNKLDQLLLYSSDKIKQTLTNFEIFNFFRDDKLILHFLFQKEILKIDETILNFLFSKRKSAKYSTYIQYFYPEIKEFCEKYNFANNDQFQSLIDINSIENFEEKRQKGENDFYICELIRNDSIEEFISYVNQKSISLSSQIETSIFETNSFLLNKKPTLIEYACFYGSIQIFKYLQLNKIELTPSLLIYSIHSGNVELISIFESNNIEPENFEKCFKESIKCHQNEIANYFEENFSVNFSEKSKYYGFKYCNFDFLPDKLDSLKNIFHIACKYNFISIVNLLLNNEEIDINKEMIQTT